MTSLADDRIVGMIGLGLLGMPIAKHLLSAGYRVTGFDINAERLSAARALGVSNASSNASLVSEADLIISVLPNLSAFEAVCDEICTVGHGRPRVLVEISTLPVESKVAAAQRLASCGVTLLDCPVLGTSAQAHAKDLVICTSGPAAAVQAVDRILAAFTRRREYLGELGAGTRMKLVANLLVGVHNAAAAEALTLANRVGIDPAAALRVLTGSAAGSRQLELRGPMMVAGVFDPATATTAVFAKDIALISEMARAAMCPTPMHSAASGLFTAALALGHAELDLSCVHTVLAMLAGAQSDAGAIVTPPTVES